MLKLIEKTPSFQTALILDAYGSFVADQGDMEKSEKLTEDALKIAESLKGSEDREVAMIKNNLATSYHSLNKLDEAEKLYIESLRVFRKHFGNYHLRVSSSLNNLAFIHIYKEDHQKALPLLKESLEIKRTILGDSHPDLIQPYSNVGSTFFNIGRYDSAEIFMKKSIDVGLINYDSENISLSRTYMWYGRLLDGMKNFKKSVYYLEKSYLIRKRELGAQNKMTLSCQSLLGQTYLNSGNYADAENHLIGSYNGLKAVTKNESESIQKTLESIVELYTRLEQKDKAAIYSKFIIDKKRWTKP